MYENNFADNTVKNTFIEKGDKTLWVVDTEFKFRTLIYVLGHIVANRSHALEVVGVQHD